MTSATKSKKIYISFHLFCRIIIHLYPHEESSKLISTHGCCLFYIVMVVLFLFYFCSFSLVSVFPVASRSYEFNTAILSSFNFILLHIYRYPFLEKNRTDTHLLISSYMIFFPTLMGIFLGNRICRTLDLSINSMVPFCLVLFIFILH